MKPRTRYGGGNVTASRPAPGILRRSTVTNAHADNENIVESDYSTEASAVALLQANQTALDYAAVAWPAQDRWGGIPDSTGAPGLSARPSDCLGANGHGRDGAVSLYLGPSTRRIWGRADATAGSFLGSSGPTRPSRRTIRSSMAKRLFGWVGQASPACSAAMAAFNKDGQQDILWRYYGRADITESGSWGTRRNREKRH